MLGESYVLILTLDVVNLREKTNIIMYMFWFIVTMTSLFYMNVVLPFGLFYTETNEEKDFKWRFCLAMRKTVTMWVVVSLILFPSYAYLRYSYIPITARTVTFTLDETALNNLFLPLDQAVTAEST